jgi:hypothetical protein
MIPLALLIVPSMTILHRSWATISIARDALKIRGVLGPSTIFNRPDVRFVQVVETNSEALEQHDGSWFVSKSSTARTVGAAALMLLRNFGRRDFNARRSPTFSQELWGLWIEYTDGRRFERYVPRSGHVPAEWVEIVHAWSPGPTPASVLMNVPGSVRAAARPAAALRR